MAEDPVDKQLDRYIESMVLSILESPQLKGLSPEKKQAITEKISEHMNDLVLETLFNRLTKEQLDDMRGSMVNPNEMEKKIEFYAASIPVFYDDLNNRLQREVVALSQILS